MTTDDYDFFEGRRHGNIVFRTTQIRAYYIGLWAWQQKKWLPDNPKLWQPSRMPCAIGRLCAGTDVEAEPAEPRSTKSANEVRTSGEFDGPSPVPGEDKRQPDKRPTDTAPLTITNPEATAAAGDEIIIDGRRFISERRFAEVLGRDPRTLQRWRQKGKALRARGLVAASFMKSAKCRNGWTEKKAGDVGGRILADDAAFGINPLMPRRSTTAAL